jgi:signal transduction histidine kinase
VGVLALVVVGLVEIGAQIEAVRSHRRLRARVTSETEARVRLALPRLLSLLGTGTLETWNEALGSALDASLATEADIVETASGRILLSRPTALPVGMPTPARNDADLMPGDLRTSVVQSGPELRALTRVAFDWNGQRCVLRLARPAPDLLADVRERQQLLGAHLLSLSVLALAAGVMLVPRRPPGDSGPSALHAYEQAMVRLRDQGEERSRAHAAERRRMEEQIQDKEAMARAGELTSGMVHEVRNGLGTILGYARLLERGPVNDGEAIGRHIREECETLEAVVRRFMDFVKRETLQMAAFDVVRTLNRVVARESRGRPGARVDLDTPEALEIVADEELLERAFENLVRNARDAAGERGRVQVRVVESADRVEVGVADDGPGIPPEKLRELRPFFTTKPGGMGLGLPIAYKIVHLHGGSLKLEPRQPRGLMVTVDLPRTGAEV